MSTKRRVGPLTAAFLLSVLGVVGLLAGPAYADDVTFTDTVPIQNTNWTASLNYPQFDPAQGTLQSVTVSITGELFGSSQVENLDAGPTTNTLELGATISVDGDPGAGAINLPTSPTSTNTVMLDAFDGTIDFDGPSGESFLNLSTTETVSQTITDPTVLAAYTGTGTVSLDASATASSFAIGGGNVVASFDTDAGASVSVTYTFEPAAEPAVDIEKATNGDDADSAPGPTVAVGSTVNWTYVVTNTGDVDLTNVVVTDDQGVAVSCPQDTLAVGESMTCTASGPAVAGPYANVGGVTADSSAGPVSDTDPSHYFGAEPAIDIEKTPDSQTVMSGSDVTFTIVVTNTGNVDLSNVAVTDPLAPDCDANIGDLAVGASTSYDCTVAAVTAGFTNVATVTGEGPGGEEVTDEDDAVVEVTAAPAPAIDVEKTPDTQTVEPGDSVTFTIVVTNTGNVDLSNVAVTDPLAPDCDATIGDLAVGASTSYDCTVAAVTAAFTNVATVTGEGPGGEEVTDEDDAVVEIAAISVVKVADATSASAGDEITYTYTVTNTGTVTLTNVELVDDKLGAITLAKTTLAPGESTTGTATATVATTDLPGPLVNVATVTGETPDGQEVTDEDDALVPLVAVLPVTKPQTLPATGVDSDRIAGFGVIMVALGTMALMVAGGGARSRRRLAVERLHINLLR